MASISISWTQFKAEALARIIPMQYVETSDLYYLCQFDGSLELLCIIRKETPASADQTEFEASYKALANKTPLQQKPFADAQGFKFRLKGYTASAPMNATTNLDIPVTEEVYINSLQLMLKNQGAADNADIVIIDKNNVLGQGANFIYDTWMTTWYFVSDSESQGEIKSPYPIKIPAGLFFRIVYRATGIISAVTVRGNFYLHKKV